MKKQYILTLIICFIISFTHLQAHEIIHNGDTTITDADSVILTVDVPRGAFQWEASSDLSAWLEIKDATSDSLGVYIDSTAWYRLRVEAENCDPFSFANVPFCEGTESVGISILIIFYSLYSYPVSLPNYQSFEKYHLYYHLALLQQKSNLQEIIRKSPQ